MTKRPRLIIFDLDYTLWPLWVDTHVNSPFTKKDGEVYDRNGKVVRPYKEVPEILEQLKAEGYDMGVASRTPCRDVAEELLAALEWKKYFKYSEIFPDCKITHFKRFHHDSKIPYKDMLFFDDEYRNIKDVTSLGVTCIEVESDGLTRKVLQQGLEEWAKKNS